MYGIQGSARRVSLLAVVLVAGLAFNPEARAECVGGENTCYGTSALISNTTGTYNTAIGADSLSSNTDGYANTALGADSLSSNTTGYANTALGVDSLSSNTAGYANTASGRGALNSNTDGYKNTATGNLALYNNTDGSYNTASGYAALRINSSGQYNTASGGSALYNNRGGNGNTASGYKALYSNNLGNGNTASGYQALYGVTTGYRNVAVGRQAGYAVTTGSDNIIIGAQSRGTASDNGVIRLGNSAYQKKTFIAGIQGVQTGATGAVSVLIDANGQLGTINSSRRFKEDIQPMGSVSERLFALRPVTFRYKEAYDDGSKPVQFGLVAEEVAEAFPELVVNDEEGKPETVSYHLLATLLLNEFQKEHRLVEAQADELAQLKQQVAMMADAIERLDRQRTIASN